MSFGHHHFRAVSRGDVRAKTERLPALGNERVGHLFQFLQLRLPNGTWRRADTLNVTGTPLSRPRLVIVLGMHRSGTSVTTNLLNAFGVPLSDDLMEPTAHNEKGYFESKEIARLHEAILATMGMAWNTSSLLVPYPTNWWLSAEVQGIKASLAAIVRDELERHGGLWGFKDPRTARLLPVWRQIVAELNIDARYLLVTRDPAEVAASLFAREEIGAFVSEVLWLEHNADALNALRDEVAGYVDYNGWLADPVAQAVYMLKALKLPVPEITEVRRIVAQVVSPGLRHHANPQATYNLPFTAPLYRALLARDTPRALAVAEIVNLSRGFTQVVLANATAGLQYQIAQLQGELSSRPAVLDSAILP